MKKYILKRIVYMVVVFFLVSILMYFLYNLIPSDPGSQSAGVGKEHAAARGVRAAL